MVRFHQKMWGFLALVVGIWLLGPPATARAGLSVTLSEVGGPTQTFNDTDNDGIITFSGVNFGDFKFDVFTVTSSSPGTGPDGAYVADTQFAVRNSASGDRTLLLSVDSDGFTAPGNAGQTLFLTNSLASSFLTGGNAAFKSALDGQWTSEVGLTGPGDSPAISTRSVVRSGASYTVSNVLTLTLGSNGKANIDATTTVTPAPAGLVLAATGLPFLGLGFWRARRRKKA